MSQSRDTSAVLRDQLARFQQQNQRLQDEHRQSMLSARTLERELVALKTDLVQERESVLRLTRESPTPVSAVRKTTAHVDQTPRPMAPYGYWASPSGYRYVGAAELEEDDDRLKGAGGGNYFEELLARIRDIRSSERVFWHKVLDIYATSIDYDPSSEASQLFFKTVSSASRTFRGHYLQPTWRCGKASSHTK